MSCIEERIELLEEEIDRLGELFEKRSFCEKMKDYIFIWYLSKKGCDCDGKDECERCK